jgi:hypothetical protein
MFRTVNFAKIRQEPTRYSRKNRKLVFLHPELLSKSVHISSPASASWHMMCHRYPRDESDNVFFLK